MMDHLSHILAPTPLPRAAVTSDPSLVCSTVLIGLTAFLAAPAGSGGGGGGGGGGKQHGDASDHGEEGQGWPAGPTAPCGDSSAGKKTALFVHFLD